jgi:hypothetical protein
LAGPRARKLLASLSAIGAAAGLVSLGLFAQSVDAADAARRIDAGRRSQLIAKKVVAKAARLAPGDRVERLFELRNAGSTGLRVVTLTVRQRQRSLLTDRKQGLRLSIDRCSRRWSRSSGPARYRCRGKRVVVLRQVPVLGRWKLKRLMLKAHGRGHLRLTLTLPARAGNALEHKTAKLRYRFTGIAPSRR